MDSYLKESDLFKWAKEKIEANRVAKDKAETSEREQYYEGANDALEELLVQWQIIKDYGVI